MEFLNRISLTFIIVIAFIFTSCKNSGKTISDSANSDNEYEFVDEAPIEDYIPTWEYEVIIKEDKAENPEESYLCAGGFKYEKIALKVGDDYIMYGDNADYYDLIKPVLLAHHIIYKFQKSNDVYPSKTDWKRFQSEILSCIKDETPDWTTIPDLKLRKSAGDFYGSIKNVTPTLYSEGADYKIYKCDTETLLGNWTYYIGFMAASENNNLGIPKGTLIIDVSDL